MGNTKSIELINKYRGQIMGVSAICIVFFHLWEHLFSSDPPLRLLYWLELGISGMGFFIKRHYFLWFISAITATYLLFPLYWRFFSHSRSKLRFTVLFIAAWYLCSIPALKVFEPIVYSFINRVQPFVLGVLLGWQQQNGGLKLSRRAVNTAAAVSAAAGLILAAVTLSAWLLHMHILTDRVLALTGSLRSRAKCAG